MADFYFNGGYVPVRNLDDAARWYKQVFDCRYSESTDDDGNRTITLQFGDDDFGMMLCESKETPRNDVPPIINTRKIAKANKRLSEKGVQVGPVQQDAQGTKFFELRDCDGNLLEVSEEP